MDSLAVSALPSLLPIYAFISGLNVSTSKDALVKMPLPLHVFEAQHGAGFFMARSISAG